MMFFSETTFHFSGDEYIFAEISREMKIESTLKAISITRELRKRNIRGILEIYPNNASYLIRYDPSVISPYHLLEYLQDVDRMKNEKESLNVETRMIEIPVLYDDPETAEVSKRYAGGTGQKDKSDFEYMMELHGFREKKDLIRYHADPVYFVTALGFKPGTAWCFPLLATKEQIIEAPKYRSPRPFTPGRSVGIGGAFTVIYPSDSTGSYQLIGRSAVPVYDVNQTLPAFKDSIFLAQPGDLWKYRPIEQEEYDQIREEVEAGNYEYNMKPILFSAEKFDEQGAEYTKQLKEEFTA